MKRRGIAGVLLLVALGATACNKSKSGPKSFVKTDHCTYAPVPATAGSGGTVEAGALSAGAAEVVPDIPVGTALGAYTGRASFGGEDVAVDDREVGYSGGFAPSIGIETAPRVKALALSAGGETVLILKADLGFTYEGHTFELEERLGPKFSGKVLITASHSHSAWGQHSGHQGIGTVGAGEISPLVYERLMDAYEKAASDALDALQPAKIGVATDTDFDPNNQVNRDRREENDELSGGKRKDDHLFLIRVDATDGTPIAALPVFGIHGTLQDYDNSLTSTDSVGAIERELAESIGDAVTVIHLQGAAGDVSPVGHGDLDCDVPPGAASDPCFPWLKNEGNGRAAAGALYAAWQDAGAQMRTDLALEALSRSVELGPYADTFTVRDGALRYAFFDGERRADGVVWESGDKIASPIDEFNAPVGAALCGETDPLVASGQMPGVNGIVPYSSCVAVDVAGAVIGSLLGVEFESREDRPICQSTRTTVTAMRIGDYLIAAMPGEVTTLYADAVRSASPVDPDKTIVLGYANGHVGYLLTPEDWLQGGYEPSINFWGPLEGEYLIEQVTPLMQMATTDEREDAGSTGTDRNVTRFTSAAPEPDTTANAGTIPGTVPAEVWSRSGPLASAQPDTVIERVSGLARFVWIGEDPVASTPRVTLQKETLPGSGEFADVIAASGKPVRDGDILLAYTPQPLADDGSDRTYYWVAEWQAVGWSGTLADARGVSRGFYRFHVTSPAGYEITSDPFEVVAASLELGVVANGSAFDITAFVHAPKGYRLLDTQTPSNTPVPLRSATVDVSLGLGAGGTLDFNQVSTSADGLVTVDAGGQSGDVVSVTVTDSYGNEATVPYP